MVLLLICLVLLAKNEQVQDTKLNMEEQRELLIIQQLLQHGMLPDGILIMIQVGVMGTNMHLKDLTQLHGLVLVMMVMMT